MNWGLIAMIAVIATMALIYVPIFLAMLVAFHKSRMEATFEVMKKHDREIHDLNFDNAIKHIIEGADNE